MDWFPILFDAQIVLLVVALVIWANEKAIIRWRRRLIRRIKRRKAGIRCTDGKIVGGIAPAMSAEEVIAVCSSLTQ